ncbi:MAG TPA: LamG-like jellyroll fold domain-containing protein [Pantanalinema sp.]
MTDESKLIKVLCLALLVGGCQNPSSLPREAASARVASEARSASGLWGRVAAGYAVQASAADLVAHATVTLLDADRQVVATGLTDAAGAFSLNPFAAFAPTTNAVYVLDARKTFAASNDRALLRFRTLVMWDGAQWRSLSGATSLGAGIRIDARTTALAAVADLRAIAGASLLGSLDPATGAFTEAAGVTSAELETVASLVSRALGANLDPVQWLRYASGAYSLALNPNARVLFDLEDALQVGPYATSSLTPVRGKDGGEAYAFSSAIALYDGQIGGQGSALGQFNRVTSVAVDRQGFIYVPDLVNNRIQKFTPDGRYIWSFNTFSGGTGTFNYPHGIGVDRDGNTVVVDYNNHRFMKFDPFGSLLWGIGSGSRWTIPVGATSGSAHNQFTNPGFCEVDASGNVWIAANYRVLKYDPNGTFLLGMGNGTKWTTSAGNQSASGSVPGAFNGWGNATVHPSGEIYVVDGGNSRVQRFDASGNFLSQWGTTGSGSGPFYLIEDLAFDLGGNAWLTGSLAHCVSKVDRQGNLLGQLGTQGSAPSQFQNPRNLAFSPDGRFYVADDTNNRVQRFIPANVGARFPTAGNLDPTKGTVSFWFKPAWTPSIAEPARCFFDFNNVSTTWALNLVCIGGTFYAYLSDDVGNNLRTRRVGVSLADFSRLVRRDEWHHVALSWALDSADLHFYLDGTEFRSYSTGAVASFSAPVPAAMGVGSYTTGASPAEATFDQFRIYDSVLSVEAIQRLARGLAQE